MRLDKLWEEIETSLRVWSEGVTIRKQEEMWDSMGSGSVGKLFTHTLKKKDYGSVLNQMGFSQGRRKISSIPGLEGTLLIERKETQKGQ